MKKRMICFLMSICLIALTTGCESIERKVACFSGNGTTTIQQLTNSGEAETINIVSQFGANSNSDEYIYYVTFNKDIMAEDIKLVGAVSGKIISSVQVDEENNCHSIKITLSGKSNNNSSWGAIVFGLNAFSTQVEEFSECEIVCYVKVGETYELVEMTDDNDLVL